MKKRLTALIVSLLIISACSSKQSIKVQSTTGTQTTTPVVTKVALIAEKSEAKGDKLDVKYGTKIDADLVASKVNVTGADNYSVFIEEGKIPKGDSPGKYTIPVKIEYNDGSSDTTSVEMTVKDPVSTYDGLKIRKDQIGQRPMMVMIDNQHDARMQANVSKASVVWEMRVEGEFTRYMALFQRNDKVKDMLLGPIRSARPNFITIANQYGAVLAHHGGSTDGMSLIYELGLDNLDGMMLEGSLFFRYSDTGKSAPHNSYLKLGEAFGRADNYGWDMKDKGKGFMFNDVFTELKDGKKATGFNVTYYNSINDIEYRYVPEAKAYERYREGVKQVDELSKIPVRPVNVIIQIADSYVYDGIHQAFESVGEGKGYYVTGGKYVEIKWSKSDDHSEPTKFMTMDGKELLLNPGQTWIQVIDSDMVPTFK